MSAPEPIVKSKIPLSSKVVATVLKHFSAGNGDPGDPRNSIGVARDSILATDGASAIVVGDVADGYEATDWREADIAVTEASVYGQAVDIDALTRIETDEGEVRGMPISGRWVTQTVETMQRVAVFDPTTLIKVGQAAKSIGASSVEILQPTGEESSKTIGFKFATYPGEELFDPDWTMPINCVGVVVAQDVRRAPKQIAMNLTDDEPHEKRRGRPKKTESTVADELAVELPDIPVPELIDTPDAVLTIGNYRLPPVSLFVKSDSGQPVDPDRSAELIAALNSHKINATPAGLVRGPTFSQYRVRPAGHVRAKSYKAAEADIQLALAASTVRIEAPIPGTHFVGVEIPNKHRQTVSLRSMLEHRALWESSSLTIPIGLDVYGRPVLRDLAKFPHLLIAGQTGSGKSIAIASLLCSLLARNTPDELRLVLIDPKMVELALFNGLPHLMMPVVTDSKLVPGVLHGIWTEMDERYKALERVGVRNIEGYNAKMVDEFIFQKLPYIVVVVDEVADLMLNYPDEMALPIQALTQKARAVGIHLVLATQRPSVNVIDGVIKANVPGRMAFRVAQANDSKVILDETGAEQLLGQGDCLMRDDTTPSPVRVQGAYVSESEVEQVVNWWRGQ